MKTIHITHTIAQCLPYSGTITVTANVLVKTKKQQQHTHAQATQF